MPSPIQQRMAVELIRTAASILLSSGSIWVIVALIQMVILGAFVNENASDGRSKQQSLPDAKSYWKPPRTNTQ